MLKLRQEDLEFRNIEGEVVAIDLRTSRYVGINESGAGLWNLLKVGTDEAKLAEHLVTEFGIEREQAERDVAAFIKDLDERGLIERTQ